MVPRSLRGARVHIGAMWSSSSGPEDPVSGKLPLLSQCYFSNNSLPNNRTNQEQTLKKEKWFLVARRQVARRRLVASGKEEAQATVDRHEKVNWKQVRYLLSLVYLLVK